MSSLMGRPPTIEKITDKDGIPSRSLSKWLSTVSQYLTVASPTNYGLVKCLVDPITIATTTTYGLLKASSDSANSTVSVTSSNASSVTGTATNSTLAPSFGFVSEAEFNAAITAINTITTLANEMKTDINTLVTDLNDLKTKLRAAGILV